MNPIEHIWDYLGRKVRARGNVHNLMDLENALIQEWNKGLNACSWCVILVVMDQIIMDQKKLTLFNNQLNHVLELFGMQKIDILQIFLPCRPAQADLS